MNQGTPKRLPPALIKTIPDNCRVCYTCVRDCPAKAIRISGGQALVLRDRCIACGNCVRVCRQNAKVALDGLPELKAILSQTGKKAVLLAPSFPAEFDDVPPAELIRALRGLGFELVCEVAAGADLVAQGYRQLLETTQERWITTACPAVVNFVQKYYPGLVPRLAPLASPMVVTARMIKAMHGEETAIVFIGPCIAKKKEARQFPEIDVVLTFEECRRALKELSWQGEGQLEQFDPPHPDHGLIFPLEGGLTQTAKLKNDLISSDILSTSGRGNFIQALKEFETQDLDCRLLDLLCCDGCLMGPGMTSKSSPFKRRKVLREYAQQRLTETVRAEPLPVVSLEATFEADDNRIPLPRKEEIEAVLTKMGKYRPEDELDCGACGYETCREHAVAILKGLAESEMCLPYTIDQLKGSLSQLHTSNQNLAEAQQALVSAEKLASMGQLSAGIAHEINNPLGIILLHAEILKDELRERSQDDLSEWREDLDLIAEQAERCKSIVAGLLNFARKNEVAIQETSVYQVLDKTLRAVAFRNGVTLKVNRPDHDVPIALDVDQMVQALTNLLRNADEAMPSEGVITLSVQCGAPLTTAPRSMPEWVEFQVHDNGTGIPKAVLPKIFEPLFTTKGIGKGTGLGLAVTYGIVKMHRGTIDVQSNALAEKGPTFTRFSIRIPMKSMERSLT